mmetsp:Transcript_50154/g.143428  ORF Transcript_50154/g.143428 Transcript_50154/m.143428 type:complete len:202 (-) Transcript_50154:1006-1611(-)
MASALASASLARRAVSRTSLASSSRCWVRASLARSSVSTCVCRLSLELLSSTILADRSETFCSNSDWSFLFSPSSSLRCSAMRSDISSKANLLSSRRLRAFSRFASLTSSGAAWISASFSWERAWSRESVSPTACLSALSSASCASRVSRSLSTSSLSSFNCRCSSCLSLACSASWLCSSACVFCRTSCNLESICSFAMRR